jgi:hypothetical protein
MVAICMLSLLSRKLLTSVSVTGLGMPGIDCMTFMYVLQRCTINISIGTRKNILGLCKPAASRRTNLAQSE